MTSSLRLITLFAIIAVGRGQVHHDGQRNTNENNNRSAVFLPAETQAGKRRNSNKRDTHLVRTNRILSELDQEHYRDPKSLAEMEKLLHEASVKTSPVSRALLNELVHPNGNLSHNKDPAEDVPTDRNTNNSSPRLRGPTKQHNHRRTTITTKKKCDGTKKIVQCKDGVVEEDCKQALVDEGVEVVSDMPHTSFFAICVDSQEEVDLVAKLTNVEGVEDDPPRTLSYVPGSDVERDLQQRGAQQLVPYGIDLVNAREFWGQYGAQGEGVTVCIIDTGLSISHEDITKGDYSGDEDGEFETWDEDPTNHGTHVAGTIMASDNNVGVVGVAPGVSLYIVRVFNEIGEYTASDLVNAMNACADGGANIINMSLGGPIQIAAEQITVRALKEKGILIVAASGNGAQTRNFVEYPASFDEVISVGAVDKNVEMADFSTFNPAIDIVGPGVDVLSTSSASDKSYKLSSGTSMATPHIVAVAALLWSQFPNSSAGKIRDALEKSARDLGACGKDRVFGHGMVDVMAAARYLESNATAPELDSCVNVSVSLVTDVWGDETRFRITPENDNDNILYRGGPYASGRQRKYTDDIQLPEGCYDLIWLDEFGDGANSPEFGTGEISLTYNGNAQVYFNDFGGFREVFKFGNCVNNEPTPSPVARATPSPAGGAVCGNNIVEEGEACDDGNIDNTDACSNLCELARCGDGAIQAGVEECDDGNTLDGDGCSSTCTSEESDSVSCQPGESLLEVWLETDRWGRSENSLFLYDDVAPDDDWIWQMEPHTLQGNTEYGGTACLDPSVCYKFFYFDSWGDGFLTGGLTLTQDDNSVLEIIPGDTGNIVEAGSAVTFWFQSFGPCAETTTSSSP